MTTWYCNKTENHAHLWIDMTKLAQNLFTYLVNKIKHYRILDKPKQPLFIILTVLAITFIKTSVNFHFIDTLKIKYLILDRPI